MGLQRSRTIATVAGGLAAATAGLTIAAPPPAAAASHTLLVASRADDGSASSLRAAIDTVNAAPGDEWTIQLLGGAPYVIDRDCGAETPDDNHEGDLDIGTLNTIRLEAAPGAGMATIAVQCEGERALDVHAGGLQLYRIRITGGNTAPGANGDVSGPVDGDNAREGGGIRAVGLVELDYTYLEGNSTGRGGSGAPPLFAGHGGDGGTGGAGSAISAGQIIARHSAIVGNRTGDGGPGGNGVGGGNHGGAGGAGGSGALVAAAIQLDHSVVADNVSGGGGAGGQSPTAHGGAGGDGGGAGGVFTSNLTTTATTIARNTAGDGGAGGTGAVAGGAGGNGGRGGGVWSQVVSVTMSTIADNAAGLLGAGGAGGVPGTPGDDGAGGGILSVAAPPVDVTFSTITGNRGATGANLHVAAGSTVSASVVGDAVGGASCAAWLVGTSPNVFGGDPSCGLDDTNLQVDGALPLGPLGDNGGQPVPVAWGDARIAHLTRMPLVDSGLEGLVPLGDCALYGYDQRGEVRPRGGCEPGAVEAAEAGASKFVPLPPQRVWDTRQAGPQGGFMNAGETRTVQFAGVAGVPADATAVAFNLTSTVSAGGGYITAYAAGGELPLASSLNTVSGKDVPNFVIVPLGDDGAVSFYNFGGGHLIADVAGYFVPANVATDGRIVPLAPSRVFDTRVAGPHEGKLAAGQSITVSFADLPAEAAAVVVNVTGTAADRPGYVTTYPTGQAQPDTSTLNLVEAGHTAANMAIVPLGADRSLTFFSDGGTHLLADITGYVTGTDALAATEGLVVPMDPVRVFDTRSGAPIAAGGTLDVPTAGTVWIDPGTTAVLLNVTAANATAAGYVTGWPTGDPQPLASMLNLTQVDETRANAAILPVGLGGAISYYSESGTHLLADAFGYLIPGLG